MANREKVGEEAAGVKKLFMGAIMEEYNGYTVAAPPLTAELSPLQLGGFRVCSSSKREEMEGVFGNNECSVLKERERRRKITQSFSVLQSLLPNLPFFPKVPREQVLSKSIDFIKQLEDEKNRLENQKKLLLQDLAKQVLSNCTSRASSVNLTISNGVAFFVIKSQVKHGFLYNVFSVFEKHQAEVLVANISVDDHQLVTLSVTVKVGSRTKMVEDITRELDEL